MRVDRELVFYENRLIIPIDMRQAVLNSIHSGHSGRDAMLGAVDEVCWPQINRQIVAAKTCGNCQKAGKNIRTIKRQKEFGTIRKPKQVNEEIALNFMGPFSGAPENRKYLLVAIDHFSAYPTLQFVKSTDIKGVEKFLRKDISNNGIPQIVRTDQATVFMGNEFRNLREEFGIRHIVCPVYDHRENGKVERLIRTVNERLRANPEILAKKQNKLCYQLVSALGISKGKYGKSPFERHTGRKPNTLTSIIVTLYKELNNLDYDKSVELDRLEDFPRDDDSMKFVRERQRKGKLAGLFKKRRGRLTKETEHTVQVAPEGKAEVTLSKREVARAPKAVRKQKHPKKTKQYAMREIETRKEEEMSQVFADLEQEENVAETDRTLKSSPTRLSRNRRAPDRYGLPVYTCGIEKKSAQK